MFDLFRSRAKAVRYLLGALLLLVAASMVITLIPGFGSGSASRSDQVLAEVGDGVLSARDVHAAVQGQLRSRAMTRETAEIIIPQLVDRMVAEMATAYQARRLGFQVTDTDLAEGIRIIAPQLFDGDKFVGNQFYEQFVNRLNMTIPQFEATVRQQLLMTKLQGLVFDGVVISPKEVEAEFRRRNETAKIRYARFDASTFKSQVSASRDELAAYLKANQARYTVPAKRSLSVIVVDEARLSQQVAIPETELRRIYEASRDRFRVEERVRVRHILLMTTGKPKEEIPKIKTKAQDLLKQLKGGADFAELAKKNSEDPGSASKGGDLDWVTKGQTVPNFEKTAFSLQPKELSDVIETEYGFHILQVLEKEPGRLKPFEEVKTDLAAERNRQAIYEKMPALAEQARQELLKDPKPAGEIAKKLGLESAVAANVAATDPIPLIGVNADLQAVLETLPVGGVSEVVQVAANKLGVVAVTEIAPPRAAELSDVEAAVRETVLQEKAQKLADEKAKEFEARLRAENNNLEKTAQALKIPLKESNEFNRGGAIDGIGTAAFLGDQPFMQPVGAVVAVYRVAQTTYFYRILARNAPDMSKLPDEREAIISGLRNARLQARRDLFEDGLVQQLIQDGKVKIYQDAVRRLVAAYKS